LAPARASLVSSAACQPGFLERIREAVRSERYDATKHAVDEMAEDGLDIVDEETAILNGRITTTEKYDLRPCTRTRVSLPSASR
jgi:hypothetical protein